MKKTVLVLSSVLVPALSQALELSCWNIFAPRGSRPVLTARVGEENRLSNIRLDPADRMLADYVYDDDSLEGWRGRFTSQIANPQGEYAATEITSARSSYRGNNEYRVIIGSWTSQLERSEARQGNYGARLILPQDLSSEALRNYRIRSPEERSNAVMVMSAPERINQSGDNYLRMFCSSR